MIKKILPFILLLPVLSFSQTFTVPDANFEQALIDLGIDATSPTNAIDGEVNLSAAVTGSSVLDLTAKNISDLTGIENFTSLEELDLKHNLLTTIDLSNNLQLEWLSVFDNNLTTLNVSAHSNLEQLHCNSNALTELILPVMSSLTWLDCGSNELSTVDFSNSSVLDKLECQFNTFETLDLNGLVSLTDLNAHNCNIETVILGTATALEDIDLAYNNLTFLDVTNQTNLSKLRLRSNDLVNLNAQNGANTLMNNGSKFDIQYNPNLTCVQVDDVDFSTDTWTWLDSQTYFSTSCTPYNNDCVNAVSIGLALDTPGTTQNATEDISNNPACQESGITILDVWYQFIAPDSGSVTMTISASSLTGKIAIYDNCGATSPLDCAADELQINNLNAGQTYYLQVWLEASVSGRSSTLNQDGNFVLNVQDTSVLSLDTIEHESNDIKLHPNPAKDEVTISSNKVITNYEIFDMTGKIILAQSGIQNLSHSISTTSLSKGIYLIKIKGEQHSITKKLIIQ
ncbi:T9SS type A sorting domain-containing protein [Winogradskyella vidalii]|uniref:T9SS type A sorting domain-containing protein n=1 Tax=Winogradskyella vidalii TaxID=2615024 RepID=UPI0015C805A5|nr:T9SS type A sorting domain-containing protein [Winogradskyella vidalii]